MESVKEMARHSPQQGHVQFLPEGLRQGSMTRHLKSCKSRAGEDTPRRGRRPAKGFHVIVEGKEEKDYWMHLEVPANARLEDPDDFLRETWLECCGRLSAFTIGDVEYFNYPVESYDQDMSHRIGRLLDVGSRFIHEYDFGTMTELSLRIVWEGNIQSRDIRILARNLPPALACYSCGAPATKALAMWRYFDERFVCDDCAIREAGEDDEGMMLPLVNSPRVGTCAYTG